VSDELAEETDRGQGSGAEEERTEVVIKGDVDVGGEIGHGKCQPGTSLHRVHVNCISHATLRHLLTHLGCVYNRSM
jgi:hypothetical protein